MLVSCISEFHIRSAINGEIIDGKISILVELHKMHLFIYLMPIPPMNF